MRLSFIAALCATLATPALAAPAPPLELPRVLTDPAMADRMGRVAEALVRAFMVIPVGEIEAAVAGRAATAADRSRTVRDIAGIDDPHFEQRIAAEAAQGGRTAQAATGAMVKALPGIMRSMEGVARDMDRAIANLPRPDYPRR